MKQQGSLKLSTGNRSCVDKKILLLSFFFPFSTLSGVSVWVVGFIPDENVPIVFTCCCNSVKICIIEKQKQR